LPLQPCCFLTGAACLREGQHQSGATAGAIVVVVVVVQVVASVAARDAVHTVFDVEDMRILRRRVDRPEHVPHSHFHVRNASITSYYVVVSAVCPC
jgi:hypothetical protein